MKNYTIGFVLLSVYKLPQKYGPQTPKICVFDKINVRKHAVRLQKQSCGSSFGGSQTIVIISALILFLIDEISDPTLAQKLFSLFRKLWLIFFLLKKLNTKVNIT